jgi:two-component system response regulator MprA
MSKGWVCLVDDDADIREVVCIVLEQSGHRVIAVGDGTEALERLAQNPGCCVILLDLMMPEMNGWEFRALQKSNPALASIPVIVLSGVRELTEAAKGLDAAAYLQKPVDLATLIAEVERYCG